MTLFTPNEGTWDRAVRILAGLLLIGLAATQAIGLWGLVGLLPLLTGLLGFCPMYQLLGISTCHIRRSH
jgi:hypothetical protein